MKTTVKSTIILLALAACAEPYDQPVNPDAQPAVVLAVFRDTVAYNGHGALPTAETTVLNLDIGPKDVITPANSADVDPFSTIITSGSAASPPAKMTVPASHVVYPFQTPRLEFNKLINSDTLEATAIDPQTGKPLGDCSMVPGALALTYFLPDTTPGTTPGLLACYSPSDRLVGTVALADDGSTEDFLHYSSAYTLQATGEIKDKQNRALTPFALTFTTAPFELLFVNDPASETIAWTAPDSGFGIDGSDATNVVPVDTQILQLVFTGAVLPSSSVPNTDSLNNISGGTPTVFAVDDDSGTETAVTAEGTQPFFGVQIASFESTPDSTDPRILLLYHPAYVASQGQESTGFGAGHYRVHLPLTFTDSGTVEGTPVTIACPDGSGGTSGEAATCTDVTFDFYVG